MDGLVFKQWMEGEFLPFARSCTTEMVALIVDNLASHSAVEDDQVVLICLPSNTTALFQRHDAGIIQALKMRYKRRFLSSLVAYLDNNVGDEEATTRATAALANTWWTSLLEVARIIEEEWAAMTEESLV